MTEKILRKVTSSAPSARFPGSGQSHERRPRRIALRLRVERNRPLGLHGDHPFDSRCGIVGRQRLRSVVVGDAGFARESGRRSRFRGRVFIGRAVVNDRDAVARLPSRFTLFDVRAGRGRAGGHDDQPVGILIPGSTHRLRQFGRVRTPPRRKSRRITMQISVSLDYCFTLCSNRFQNRCPRSRCRASGCRTTCRSRQRAQGA